jgi:hypothetical protein
MSPASAFERQSVLIYQHAPEAEYTHFVHEYTTNQESRKRLLRAYRRFIQHYPDLRGWLQAPLAERVGRLYGDDPGCSTYPISYEARPLCWLHGTSVQKTHRLHQPDFPFLSLSSGE